LRLPILGLLLVPALVACTLPRDEGRRFRERVTALNGRPTAEFPELIAMDASETQGRRVYAAGVFHVGNRGDACDVEVITEGERVVSGRVTGGDYDCGELATELRKRADRYRRDPTLRAREEQEQREMLKRLVDARKVLNEPKE
jgi:hypothetical protein